jgi:hypothetical protein
MYDITPEPARGMMLMAEQTGMGKRAAGSRRRAAGTRQTIAQTRRKEKPVISRIKTWQGKNHWRVAPMPGLNTDGDTAAAL